VSALLSAELMRLDWKDVKLEDRAIGAGQQMAKTRSRRVVEMCDALHAWLNSVAKSKGPIVDVKRFLDNMAELKKAAGIESWPHNGLRHSFGSYHLAYHGDAVKTAQQMGHRSSDVVHNHYKALVLKREAERFWNLKPKTEAEGKQKMWVPPSEAQ
jgi:integrase